MHILKEWVLRYRKSLLGTALLVCLAVIIMACASGNSDSAGKDGETEHYLFLDITYKSNLLFAKYPIDVYLDDELRGTVPHGEYFSDLVRVEDGKHRLTFYRADDHSVVAEETVKVARDMTYSCRLCSNLSSIDVDKKSTSDTVPTPTPRPVATPIPVAASKTEPEPAPTEAPAATATPVPTEAPAATATPVPTEAPRATAAPEPTEAPAATATPVPAETPKVTAASEPTKAPQVTASPEATPVPEPTQTPESTVTPVPETAPTDIPSGEQTGLEDEDENEDEEVVMVWVSTTGTKYHSKPTCSNMKEPKQITWEEAVALGYTPCSKCH